jgi:hypothetical protein
MRLNFSVTSVNERSTSVAALPPAPEITVVLAVWCSSLSIQLSFKSNNHLLSHDKSFLLLLPSSRISMKASLADICVVSGESSYSSQPRAGSTEAWP